MWIKRGTELEWRSEEEDYLDWNSTNTHFFSFFKKQRGTLLLLGACNAVSYTFSVGSWLPLGSRLVLPREGQLHWLSFTFHSADLCFVAMGSCSPSGIKGKATDTLTSLPKWQPSIVYNLSPNIHATQMKTHAVVSPLYKESTVIVCFLSTDSGCNASQVHLRVTVVCFEGKCCMQTEMSSGRAGAGSFTQGHVLQQ